MRRIFSGIFIGFLLLTACVPAHDSMRMENHDPSMMSGTEPLTMEDRSLTGELGFEILNNGKHFADYGISHTKQMHLILVRSDLTNFQHLHPVMDSDGIWRVPFASPPPGDYWLYADFVDSHDHPYVLRLQKHVDGDAPAREIVKSMETTKKAGPYTVKFSSVTSGDGPTLRFDITGKDGKPVALEPYLGARGHVILIDEKGEYEHTHDVSGQYVGGGKETDPLDVAVPAAPSAYYRVFTQFQIAGKVYTVDFDWDTRS